MLEPPFKLNPEQEHLYFRLREFCNDSTAQLSSPGKQLIITGSAGTGKTSIIIYFIISNWLNSKYAYEDINYILCAPTNKAKDVMYNKYMITISKIAKDTELHSIYPTLKRKLTANVKFKTISQVLGINIQINNDGLHEFTKGDNHKIKSKYLAREYDNTIIIVDESSMIDTNCATKLKHIPRPIIYLGDRCQLPPVNEESSTIFKYDAHPNHCELINLTTVERAHGDIVIASNHLRDRMQQPHLPNLIGFLTQATPVLKNDETVVLYPGQPNKWFATYVERILDQQNNLDMGLTWTNKRCTLLNTKIRNLIHQASASTSAELAVIMRNEKILIKDPYYQYDERIYSSMVLCIYQKPIECMYQPLSFTEWFNSIYYANLISHSRQPVEYKPINLEMINAFKHTPATAKKKGGAVKGKTLGDYGFVKSKDPTTTLTPTPVPEQPLQTTEDIVHKKIDTYRCTFTINYPYYEVSSHPTNKDGIKIVNLVHPSETKGASLFDYYLSCKPSSSALNRNLFETGITHAEFKDYHMFATKYLYGIPVEKTSCKLCVFLAPKLIPFIQDKDPDILAFSRLTHGLTIACYVCKSKCVKSVNIMTPESQERYNIMEQEVHKILQNCSQKKITMTKQEYVAFNRLLNDSSGSPFETHASSTNPTTINLSYLLGHYWSHCFVDVFAKWDYGYFITVHKSQGSDYDNVFLDYFDLVSNTKHNERDRLIYTGLTRARSKCHVYFSKMDANPEAVSKMDANPEAVSKMDANPEAVSKMDA